MGNPTTEDIWKRCRGHLNDRTGQKYTNDALLTYTQDAQDELEDALQEIGSELFGETSAVLAVPALTTEIRYTVTNPVLPADLVEVRDLYEKASGADISTFVPMGLVKVLVPRAQGVTLDEYVWEEQALKFIGATGARDIRILYKKGFPAIIDPADQAQIIPFNRAAPFMSYKISALAAELIAQNHTRALVLHQSAEVALDRILNNRTRQLQSAPRRRRAWTRDSRRRGGSRTLDRTR
jgi:hypothetical protein